MFCNLSGNDSKSELFGSARVKFLRKALIPRNEEQFKEFCNNCEVLISTPLKLA